MKNTQIEWIGDIPDNWDVKPISTCFKERNEKVSDYEWEPLSVTKQGIVKQLETAAKSDAHDARKKVCKNDFVINSRSDRKQSCGVSPYNGSVSLINIVLENRKLNPKFVNYLLKNYGFAEEFYRYGSGIVADLWSTNYQKMKKIMIPIPPKEQQEKIADFLDKKTLEIDNIIEKTRENIEDYKKYKQSIITEAVTKGLEKNVELKDSGIDWIGEIPEEWNVCKIKYILQDNEFGIKCGPFGSALTGRVSGENNIYIYGQWNIVDDDFSIKRNTINEESYALLQNYSVISGDILVSMMGTIGKCAIVPNNINKGIIDSHVIKIRLNEKKVLSKFFKYQYDKDNSFVIMEHLNRTKKGSIMDGLNTAIVKNAYFVLPPLNDQERIIKFLDKKVDEIDRIINNKLKIIEELEQYKKSLIYEYVTGKKKVI